MDRERNPELERQMNRWNNRITYAAAISRRRHDLGLSRAELATRARVAEERIRELEEADVDRLSEDEAERLAAALGTTWADLSGEARRAARAMREDQ